MKRLLIVEIEHCGECMFFSKNSCINLECDLEGWTEWWNECEDSWPGVFSKCPLPKITGDPDGVQKD